MCLGLALSVGVAAGQAPPNDNCGSPLPIAGSGTYGFDNTQATTGLLGQNSPNCVGPNGTRFDNDLFYCWTADCTGLAFIDTCGQTGLDTKLAIYQATSPACACPPVLPPPAAFCCDDDTCGLQSTFNCEVVCGEQYLIHIGSAQGTGGGLGSFTISCQGQPCVDSCCLPTGQCATGVPPIQCTGQGGTPMSTGCTGTWEECCYADGSNLIQDPACCTSTGGTPQGPGTGDVSFAPGACCLPAGDPLGTCAFINPLCCQSRGGTFLGPFTACAGDLDGNGLDDACQPPPACDPLPGVFGCTPTICPDPITERCNPKEVLCDPAGNCTVVNCDCMNKDGCRIMFNGPNQPFCVGYCPIPGEQCELQMTPGPAGFLYRCDCGGDSPEACCMPDGTCAMMPATQCQAVGGVPLGPGTLCQGIEACCYLDAAGLLNCQNVDATCCDKVLNGSPQGAGSACQGDLDGDGIDDECQPPVCQNPPPGAIGCPPVVCPIQGDRCQSRCMDYDPATGQVSIVDCDCSRAGGCHAEVIPGTILPACVGPCPANMVCQETTTTDPVTGIVRTCCDCVDDIPAQCGPTTDGHGCEPVVCPIAGQECVPTCMQFDPATGQTIVLGCECRYVDECHPVASPYVPPFEPSCEGICPPGQSCNEQRTTDPLTGFVTICCDCRDTCPVQDPTDPADPCSYLQTYDCIQGGPNEQCLPTFVQIVPGPVDVPWGIATACDCTQLGTCGPVQISTDALGNQTLSCPGDCVPPEMGVCQLFVNDSPLGVTSVLSADLPLGSLVRCDCDIVPDPLCPTFEPAAVDICGPLQAQSCRNGSANEFCLPKSVHWDPATGQVTALACECAPDNSCHVQPIPGAIPACIGTCPNTGQACEPVMTPNPLGGFDISCDCCAANDVTIDLATGLADGGGLIGVGSSDDTWRVTSEPPPVGILPRWATVVNPHPAWLTIPGSRWISANLTGPNGNYTYKYCFCLDAQFQNAQVNLSVRADDVGDVYLNGYPIGTIPPLSFLAASPTTIATSNQAFFLAGQNCIEVVVRNTAAVVTGLDLVGQVTAANAQCCCEPTSDGSSCKSVNCSTSAQKCRPTKVHCAGGSCTVLECDCAGTSECAIEFEEPGVVFCAGGCQVSGQTCRRINTVNPDGSVDVECRCGIICDVATQCDDNNVCTCDQCVANECVNAPAEFGNVNCAGPAAPNLDDILCTLGGFANYATCPNADLYPPCTGNNIVNLDDILAMLGAFSGADPCGCP